jgi:hypothetical protein
MVWWIGIESKVKIFWNLYFLERSIYLCMNLHMHVCIVFLVNNSKKNQQYSIHFRSTFYTLILISR